jgi:putative aldouronate transport system permease protein
MAESRALTSGKIKPKKLSPSAAVGRFFRFCARDKFLIALALPGIINFLLWHYGPMYGIIIAFKDYNMKLGILGSPWAKNFGMDEVISFLKYPYLGRLMWNTFYLNLLMMVVVPIPGIIYALFLNEVRLQWFKRSVQTVSYFPYFMSSVAVVSMFVLILSPSSGMVNNVLKTLGMKPIYFLMLPEWFRPIMIIMTVWQTMGWDTIIWLARIAGIDPGLYESATIDGATRLQRMWHITLPAFKDWYIIGLVFSFGSLLGSGSFEKIYLLYNASIAPTADTLGIYMYMRGIQFSDYSYGAAIGFVNTLICLGMILAANWAAKKFTNVSIWG